MPTEQELTAQFPIQNVGMIPWALAERAYAIYTQHHGNSQSLQRLAERGGFGLAELGFLLRGPVSMDYVQLCEFATREIVEAMKADRDALRERLEKLQRKLARLSDD